VLICRHQIFVLKDRTTRWQWLVLAYQAVCILDIWGKWFYIDSVHIRWNRDLVYGSRSMKLVTRNYNCFLRRFRPSVIFEIFYNYVWLSVNIKKKIFGTGIGLSPAVVLWNRFQPVEAFQIVQNNLWFPIINKKDFLSWYNRPVSNNSDKGLSRSTPRIKKSVVYAFAWFSHVIFLHTDNADNNINYVKIFLSLASENANEPYLKLLRENVEELKKHPDLKFNSNFISSKDL
jgi:hypothetical protein